MTTHKRINLLKRLGRIIEMGPRVAKETRRASGCCASWSNSNTCARGPTRLGAPPRSSPQKDTKQIIPPNH